MTDLMREIDLEYRAASGITDRRFYKIYYSHIHSFPLLILGQNPGGESDGTDLAASDSYFEGWEHDYVRFRNDPRYTLAGPMCRLLADALDTCSTDALRQVPATNVIFQRSRNTSGLNLTLADAAKESRPHLGKVIREVGPHTILLISKTAYDLFIVHHCERKSVQEDVIPRIYTPNGRHRACIFLSARARASALNREVNLFVVGHPSKFADRHEWSAVLAALRDGITRVGLRPINEAGVLRDIPAITSYDSAL